MWILYGRYKFGYLTLEVKDKSKYQFDKSKYYAANWDRLNCYSYESVLPLSVSDQQRMKIMQQDLNRYLSLNGRMEVRRMPCLVLSRATDDAQALFQTKGGKYINTLNATTGIKQIQNEKLSNILWQMNEVPASLPTIDETHFTGNADIVLAINSFSDTTQLKNALVQYGLCLSKEDRGIEVFVLSEITP